MAAESFVDIKFDEGQLETIRELLGGFPKAFPRVISRALNRAALTMRSNVSHKAAKTLELLLRVVKARVTYDRSTVRTLTSRVHVRDKGFSYWWFKPKQTATGVQLRKGPRIDIPHAFIAEIFKTQFKHVVTGMKFRGRTLPNADYVVSRAGQRHPGVYKRVGRPRFPVKHQRSEGVIAIIQKAGGWNAEYEVVMENLSKRLKAETERVLVGGKWSAVKSSINETWAEWRSRMGPQEFR